MEPKFPELSSQNANDIIRFQKTEVYIPGMKALLKRVRRGFQVFLKEDLEYRKQWTIDKSGKNEPDHGWVRRDDGSADTEEHKHVFHFYPGLADDLLLRGVPFEKYESWLKDLLTLYRLGEQGVCSLGRELDKMYPQFDLESRFAKGDHKLRLNLYDLPHPDQQTLAFEHFDLSGLSLNFKESAPGFCSGPDDDEEYYHAHNGKVLLFAGLKIQIATGGEMFTDPKKPELRMAAGGLIKALIHRVKKLPTRVASKKKRGSTIFFGHIDGIYIP